LLPVRIKPQRPAGDPAKNAFVRADVVFQKNGFAVAPPGSLRGTCFCCGAIYLTCEIFVKFTKNIGKDSVPGLIVNS
jgi:hypothetical protein